MKRPGSLGKCFIFSDGNEVIVVECVHESPPEKHLSCCQKYGEDSNSAYGQRCYAFFL